MSKNNITYKKNYLILVLITLIVVILTLYINAWIKTYKDNKISISPFSGVTEEVNINEIGLTLSEMNEVILYVGYTNDKVIYEMEEKLLKYIKKRGLIEDKKEEIKGIPILIYVKSGKADMIINSNNKVITTYELATLSEKYGLEN